MSQPFDFYTAQYTGSASEHGLTVLSRWIAGLIPEGDFQITQAVDFRAQADCSFTHRPLLHALIIDKNLAEVRLVDRILSADYRGAYTLRRADSLATAKQILRTHRVDVVLLDSETIEAQARNNLIRELRAIDELVPTILISGETDPHYVEVRLMSDIHHIVDKFHLRDRIANNLLEIDRVELKRRA